MYSSVVCDIFMSDSSLLSKCLRIFLSNILGKMLCFIVFREIHLNKCIKLN